MSRMWRMDDPRNSSVTLQTVEQNVQTGTDVNSSGTTLCVIRVHDTESGLHHAASDSCLERHGRDVQNRGACSL